MRENRAILELVKLELHFLGPADYNLPKEPFPGTDTFQLEIAPSGHLVLPCCEYQKGKPTYGQLTLLSKLTQPVVPQRPPPAQASPLIGQAASSSWTPGPPAHTA